MRKKFFGEKSPQNENHPAGVAGEKCIFKENTPPCAIALSKKQVFLEKKRENITSIWISRSNITNIVCSVIVFAYSSTLHNNVSTSQNSERKKERSPECVA